MKIRPLNDRVVVRLKVEEQTSAGGIVLPGSAKEKTNEGEVIAVGEGRLLNSGDVRPLTVKVGDNVIFGGFAGNNNTIQDGDDELVVISEGEILGIIEG